MSFLSRLEGRVTSIGLDNKVYLAVGPFGLTLSVPQPERFQIGQQVTFITHLIWREDSQNLYGFISEEEKSLFLKLIKVRTLGPKIALSILSWDRSQFISACQNKDQNLLTQISGVGPKMAAKIIADIDCRDLGQSSIGPSEGFHDFKAALSQLGFTQSDIYKAYEKIDTSLSIEEKIREGLKLLGDLCVRS